MIYFDNAATSFPKPKGVAKELARAIRLYSGNPGRSGHRLSLLAAEKIYETRLFLSELLDFQRPENLIFTMNATYALNIAIKAYVRQGMHVLVGNREHNAVLRPVHALSERGVITYDVFNAELEPNTATKSLLRPETGLLILNHVSNVDGFTADVAAYAAFCRNHGIKCIIDASQSAGHRKLSFRKIGADVVCAPLHKGLLGVQGVGIACFSEKDGISTLIEGGSGSSSFLQNMPSLLPDRLEAGTLPTPAIGASLVGARFVETVGCEEIHARESELLARATDILSDFPDLRVYAPKDLRGGVLSFAHEGLSSEELARRLSMHSVCVRGGFHCAPLAHRTLGTDAHGTVRISFSYLNKPSEIDRFYKILKEILR